MSRKTEMAKAINDSFRTVQEAQQGVVKTEQMSFARSVGKPLDVTLLAHLDPRSIDAILKFLK